LISILGLIGIILVILGIIFILISLLYGSREEKIDSLGVILIGPFPIVWGSNKKYLVISLAILLLIAIISVAMYLTV